MIFSAGAMVQRRCGFHEVFALADHLAKRHHLVELGYLNMCLREGGAKLWAYRQKATERVHVGAG